MAKTLALIVGQSIDCSVKGAKIFVKTQRSNYL